MPNPVGDASLLSETARQLRAKAGQLEDLYGASHRELGAITWIGRRSTRVSAHVDARRRPTAVAAADLRAVARGLDNHAEWVRGTIRELEGIESRVRAWAVANPPGSSPIGIDASLIGAWPTYCSFDWRALQARLRAVGAGV